MPYLLTQLQSYFIALCQHLQQAVRMAARYAPPLSSPMNAQAARAPLSRRNVAVVFHAQYVLTVTAAQLPHAIRTR